MRTLDKFETILAEAKPSFVVMGNLTGTDYDFVGEDRRPATPEALASYAERGMGFLGVVGLVAGQPRTALAEPLDTPAIKALTSAFLEIIAAKLRDGDPELRELYALWALPDARPTN